jgi:nucleotide-binding universal stress UspA family protein
MLVALDGSEHSNYALNYALDLADKYSPNITLISVFHQVYIPFTEEAGIAAFEVREKCLEEQKNQHEKILTEALEKIKKANPSLKVSMKLVEGRPADRIVEIAKEGNFDIIVMGSRGLGGIKELVLGSVSDRVADHAPCPVLIVKATCPVTFD